MIKSSQNLMMKGKSKHPSQRFSSEYSFVGKMKIEARIYRHQILVSDPPS